MTQHGACGHDSSRSMWPWLITEHVAMEKLPSLLAQRVMTGNDTIKLLLVSPVRPQQGVAARPGVHPWLGLGSTLVNSPLYNILIDSSMDISAEDHLPAQYLDADMSLLTYWVLNLNVSAH